MTFFSWKCNISLQFFSGNYLDRSLNIMHLFSQTRGRKYKLPDGISRVNISHNRIPLQDEMHECLREEHKLHKQVSDIKNEPLLWDMRASKVTCRLPQKEFNNTDALLVKADKLWWHAQRFQVMEIDKEEIKLRESLTCKIRVYNKLHKLEDHTKIVDYLGIGDDQVKSVRQLPGRGWQLS